MPIEKVLVTSLILFVSLLSGCGTSDGNLPDRQWLDIQRVLQEERSEIGRQRDQLEADRRDWAARERRDSLLAAAVSSSALLVSCMLPLVLMCLLLWPRKPEPVGEVVADLLIRELASTPSRPAQLTGDRSPRRLVTRRR